MYKESGLVARCSFCAFRVARENNKRRSGLGALDVKCSATKSTSSFVMESGANFVESET